MLQKASDTMKKYQMFPQGAKIVVGLSGGADSVALLHFLNQKKSEFSWEITALHVHHGLRGAEAERDAEFAEKFAASLQVPCTVVRVDVREEARKNKQGEEETGRKLRYQAFHALAGEEGYIAVAHHQKDQAETMLMRLCRGTGISGLLAMQPIRERICRPLLFCSKKEIEQYCMENGLAWREDKTNLETKYTRNKVRLQILPLLEEINARAVEHISDTAAILSLEEAYLEEQAEACFQLAKVESVSEEICFSRRELQKMHPAMCRRVLRKALSCFLQKDITRIQIEAIVALIEKESGKRMDLPQGICVQNRYEHLVFSQKKEKKNGFCYPLLLGQTQEIPEIQSGIRLWIAEKADEISQDIYTKIFDYDKINKTLCCRSRKSGDFIRLRGGRKKIKDIFIDKKLPREQRENYPLIAMDQEILWLPGLNASSAFEVDEHTKRYLYIEIWRERI